MKNSIGIFFLGIFIAFFPVVGFAADDWYSQVIPQEVLQQKGIAVTVDDLSLHIPPGIYTQDTRVRIQKEDQKIITSSLSTLPNGFRSPQDMYTIFTSVVAADRLTVRFSQISFGQKNLRKRIFFYSEEEGRWHRLHTQVNRSQGTVEAILPVSTGKVALATHSFKKEIPRHAKTFASYPGTPFSDTAAVLDMKSGKFLYRQEATKQRTIASLTKLITTFTFLETHPDLNATITYFSQNNRDGATVLLSSGEQLSLNDVLMGTLLASANNMAQTLAVSTAVSESNFVQQMNNHLQELGLRQTVVFEPTGLDERNVSTAGNMARFAQHVFTQYPDLFFLAAQTTEYELYTKDTGRHIHLETTNGLFSDDTYEIRGFKTGYLPGSAERTYIVFVKKRSTGHEIVLSLLGNPEYQTIFSEARQLADWTFRNWEFPNY